VVARTPGIGVWLTRVRQGMPPVLLHHVQQSQVLHETVVLLTILSDRRPRVPLSERNTTEPLGHGCYRLSVRLGFMQRADIPQLLRSCTVLNVADKVDQARYYVGREIVVRKPKRSAMSSPAFAIFAFLTRIASRRPDFYKIPDDSVAELGFRVVI
jgi:KUP system potassium uptake protein